MTFVTQQDEGVRVKPCSLSFYYCIADPKSSDGRNKVWTEPLPSTRRGATFRIRSKGGPEPKISTIATKGDCLAG